MRFPNMCDQQNPRSSYAYAQSDQSLRCSLEYSVSVKLLTEYHLEPLSSKGGRTGPSESALHCWKPHKAAHIYNQLYYLPTPHAWCK